MKTGDVLVEPTSKSSNVVKEFYERGWTDPKKYSHGDPMAPVRYALLWKLVQESGMQPSALLDIGSGEGALVAEAHARGLRGVGMDIAESAAARARAKHPECTFVVNAIEDRPWPFEPESFDIVASFEVIEHLMRPSDLIKGAYEMLKPGGYIALTTPYHGMVKNLAIAAFAHEKHYKVEGSHIRFFTDPAFTRVIENNGFKVRTLEHIGRRWPVWECSYIWAQKVS